MKQRIFSGIQPSGNLHIGNYLGAIKNWVTLQNQYDSIFCVVDLHAITVPQDPEVLHKKTLEVAKIYLAAGINPEKCSIFVQSHISEHAELCWILNTIAKTGELFRMTQFKDKSEARRYILKKKRAGEIIERKIITQEEYEQYQADKTGVGLLDYPVLMAADILLYDTNLVPVGKDQLQHIEITQRLANRFNKRFGETFIIPEAYTTKESENIMGLDDPNKKMSKSAKSEYNYISLVDSPEMIRKKIKKAVTDSGSKITYSEEKPALRNLINIYSLVADKSPKEIEKMYSGKGYADFKKDLAETLVAFMKPFQEKMEHLTDEKVLEILRQGSERVRPLAAKKLREVKKKVGFVV